MDYNGALALFTKRAPERRKLANKTYALRVEEGDDVFVDIELFEKRIIRFHPHGPIEIDNHNYWSGPTTKDRLNRFLPGRANIHSYYVRKDQRVWLIADGPYANGFYGTDLKRAAYPCMGARSARATVQKVQAYANDFSHAYARGEVSYHAGRCTRCSAWITTESEESEEEHLLWHLDSGYFASALLELAVKDKARGGNAAYNLQQYGLTFAWSEHAILWKRPRTEKGRIEQLERQMKEGVSAIEHPRTYRLTAREALEDFLLTGLGFETWDRSSSN